jgi:hypothetical protein
MSETASHGQHLFATVLGNALEHHDFAPVAVFGDFAQFIVIWLIAATGLPTAAAYYALFGVRRAPCSAMLIRPLADPGA